MNWEIEWGKGSAFNFGRVKDNPFASDYRIERYRDEENKWRYFIYLSVYIITRLWSIDWNIY